jgi:hypothetical protein
MPFAPFYEHFLEVAREETRSLIVMKPEGRLPAGTYTLTEMFCDEEGCDCRRVVFQVWSDRGRPERPDVVATISFGWEPESFYREWARFPLSKEDLDELKGPGLMRMAPQSEYAAKLLPHVRAALTHEFYVDRIVRHYAMYREVVDARGPRTAVVRSGPKPGRNEPCPCGSGKKYKHCCGASGAEPS